MFQNLVRSQLPRSNLETTFGASDLSYDLAVGMNGWTVL